MIAAALLALAALPADTTRAAPQPDGWFFTGTIGRNPVQLELRLAGDDRLDGGYAYDRVGTRLALRGTRDARGAVALEETPPVPRGADREPRPTGRFSGRLAGDTLLTGTWRSTDGRRALPFALRRRARYWRLADSVAASTDTLACPGPALGISASVDWVRFDRSPWAALNDTLERAARREVDSLRAAAGRECGSEVSWTTSVRWLSDSLLSLGVDVASMFQGAAHPNSGFAARSWRAEGGVARPAPLGLLVTLTGACGERIARALHVQLVKQEASSADDVLDVKKLPDRAVTPHGRGLDVTFSPYEVASYAEGYFEARLGWQDLAGCVPADSPLRPLMRR